MANSGSLGLIFVGVGAVSGLLSLFFFFRTRRFLEGATTAQGTVLELAASTSSEGGTSYSPVVQFTTNEGQSHTFRDRVSTNPPGYDPGDPVKVKYTPGDLGSARIGSGFRLWFLPGFSALFAVIFLGVGIPIYLSGSDTTSPQIPDISALIGETTLPGSLPGGLPTGLPGGLEGIPASGATVIVQDGSGIPQTLTADCASIRDVKHGDGRAVRLGLGGETLEFTARPFEGPAAYVAGQNLEVGGSLFDGAGGAAAAGAVVFDQSGQAGVVNLAAGAKSATGNWDCSGVEVRSK